MKNIRLLPFVSVVSLLVPDSFAAQAIAFEEILTSYAWGSSGTISGTLSLNIWNDTTGEMLTSDNGDLPDLTLVFSTTLGALGSGGFEYTSSQSLRSNQSFTGTVSTNNPGSRVVNTLTILFADHLSITNLNADFTSLNSTGITWETSRISVLQPDGTPFSSAPTLSPYLSHTPLLGSSSSYPGHYFSDSKATVTGVGTSLTASGSATGSLENLTGTSGNSLLDYADLNLSPGTRIGGFVWTSVLEDTRGTSNANSALTSTLTNLSVSGTIIPESSVFLLTGVLPVFLTLRRRSD